MGCAVFVSVVWVVCSEQPSWFTESWGTFMPSPSALQPAEPTVASKRHEKPSRALMDQAKTHEVQTPGSQRGHLWPFSPSFPQPTSPLEILAASLCSLPRTGLGIDGLPRGIYFPLCNPDPSGPHGALLRVPTHSSVLPHFYGPKLGQVHLFLLFCALSY